MELTLDQLKIEKATQSDWESILEILEETRLTYWFCGNESYSTFYVTRDSSTKKIICCFSIEFENTVGILKSFAVRKKLQVRGIGKFVVSKIPKISSGFGIKKLYATSQESPDFWRKTIFKEIDKKEVTEPYAIKYLKYIETKLSKDKKNYSIFRIEN